MADNGQQENGLIETVAQGLPPGTVILTGENVQGVQTAEVSEDILRKALEEASESFGEAVVQYSETDQVPSQEIVEFNCVSADGTEVSPEQIVGCLPPGVQLITNADGTQSLQNGFGGDTIQVVSSGAGEENNVYIDGDTMASAPTSDDPVADTQAEPQPITQTAVQEVQLSGQAGPVGQSAGINLTVLPSNQSGAPLGSSLNPIRIIQQGNQYTPIQHLTAEQLQQIMQVVQQQQVAKSAQQVGGTSILFNPQTNTRIVYRVIYPSELHKNAPETVMTITDKTVDTSSQGQQTLLPQKRAYRKRNREEEDKLDGPELSKEEREERKKIKTKTRSGRVSKPPKHMVKDYKHIHVLDWDEEPYDDSDGGYSDFKCSDEEREKISEKHPADTSLELLNSTRPKNWKCETCKKAYIGRAGLGRHFKLYPDHGQLEDELEGGASERGNSNFNGLNSADNFSEDSNTQDSFTTSTPTFMQAYEKPATRKYGRYNIVDPVKRRARLKELMRKCDDDELMDIVLPRISRVLSIWEFFLTKIEKGKPPKIHVGDIYQEFAALHKKVKKMCQEYLKPLSDTGCDKSPLDDRNLLQVDNAVVAESLGLHCGKYLVKEILQEKPPQVKVAPSPMRNQQPVTNKSNIHVISKADLIKQQQMLNKPIPSNIQIISKSDLTQPQTKYIIKSPVSSKNIVPITSQPTSIVKSVLTQGNSAIKVAPHNISQVPSTVSANRTASVVNGYAKLNSVSANVTTTSANTIYNKSSATSQMNSTSYVITSQGKIARGDSNPGQTTSVKTSSSSSLPPYIQTVLVPRSSTNVNSTSSVAQSVIVPQVSTNASSLGQTVLIPQISTSAVGQTVIIPQSLSNNSSANGQMIFVQQASTNTNNSNVVQQTIIPQTSVNAANSGAVGKTIIPEASPNTSSSGAVGQTLITQMSQNTNNPSAVGQTTVPQTQNTNNSSAVEQIVIPQTLRNNNNSKVMGQAVIIESGDTSLKTASVKQGILSNNTSGDVPNNNMADMITTNITTPGNQASTKPNVSSSEGQPAVCALSNKSVPEKAVDKHEPLLPTTQYSNVDSKIVDNQQTAVTVSGALLPVSPSAMSLTVMSSPSVTSSPSVNFSSITTSPSINFGMLTNSPVSFGTNNTTPTCNEKTVSYISLLSGNTVHMSSLDNDTTTVQLSNENSVMTTAVINSQSTTLKTEVPDTLNTPPQHSAQQLQENICNSNGDITVEEEHLMNNVTMATVEGERIEQNGETVLTQETEYISADQQAIEGDQLEGHILTSPDQIITSNSNIYQTPDGTIIIQNPDGTTFQLQGAQDLPLEAVQELLVQAMETAGEMA